MPQVVPGVSDPRATRQDLDRAASTMPATRGEVATVLIGGGTTGTLTDLLGREGQRRWDDAAEALGFEQRSRLLTPEQATEQYGIEGQLTFDRPVSEREAIWRQSAKRDELSRLDILQRNDSVGGLEALGLSILGGLVDPVAVPLNFVPVVGQEQLAARVGLGLAATRSATALRGAALGVAEGAVIGGAQEGLVYGLAGQREGRDYDLQDLMLGVTASALFGGGARGALEGLGWRPPEVSLAAPQGLRVTREAGGASGAALAAGDPVADLIRQRARAAGEDPEAAVAIAMIESRLDPNARNPKSSAAGVFQFIDETWANMGGGDKFDADLNVRRGVQLMRENREALSRALGRDPQPWELYLAHQQGAAGATAMLRNPERPAVEVLQGLGRSARKARAAVELNAGDVNATAGDFAAVWRRKYAEVSGAPASAPVIEPVPEAVSLLSNEGRVGAMARALDDMAQDRPVNVGALVESELASPGRARPPLDEATDAPISIPHRLLDDVGDDRAVTVRGTEVPVRYAIVEAEDLITSHDDDLISNPQFPGELQPRDRERAGSQARLLRMEKEFSPRRLMTSPDAESGAPIVAGDGVVESGNGRTIMLRRNMRRGTPVDKAYRGELVRRGFDVDGFDKPVLVRIRTQAMDGGSRVKLTSEMNGDVTERLSATEQAFADAQAIDDQDLGLFQGGEVTALANDAFARRFIDKAGAGQENDLVDGATQRLSQSGVERVQAAMVARAYGDRSLVYALFETQDNTIKAIGKGLMGAAPDWARMRAASARGELSAGADTTEALTAAVALVRHARENRIKLGELVEDWADQDRLLGGEALSPATKAYLRTFFRDDALKTPSSADHIAETLRATAAKAIDTTPGPDLFGASHAFDAATILERTSARLRQEAGDADAGLFGPGAGPAAGADRGGDGGGQPQASGRPGSEGGQGGGGGDAGAGPRDRPDAGRVAEAASAAEPQASGRAAWGEEVERLTMPPSKGGARKPAEITVYERGDEWGAAFDYNAPTLGGGGPPVFFPTRDEAVAAAVARLRRASAEVDHLSGADNAALARIRAWTDETFGAEAKAAVDPAARDRPEGNDLEEAGGKDPELQELEDDIAAMEAEVGFYAESGRLDPDVVETMHDGAIDHDTWQTAIDAAALCLAEGGE
jgi:hypothetical protein